MNNLDLDAWPISPTQSTDGIFYSLQITTSSTSLELIVTYCHCTQQKSSKFSFYVFFYHNWYINMKIKITTFFSYTQFLHQHTQILVLIKSSGTSQVHSQMTNYAVHSSNLVNLRNVFLWAVFPKCWHIEKVAVPSERCTYWLKD